MFERRSLRLPITLGVVMIVLVVLLLVGWIFLSILSAFRAPDGAGIYWALLSVGATFLALVLVGVVIYLILTIKAVNLSRRQSNFIDSVTHELKSPIASLKLYLQTLNRRQVSPEEAESFYKIMLEDVGRLDNLINHLLDAARLEKDRTPAEAEDLNLAAVLRTTAEIVCQRHQTPTEVVKLDLVPCTVHAAPVDLELIFRNLIDNAIKYASDDAPQVEVSLRPGKAGKVIVRISDNGRGIPPQYRRKLFSRFMRLGLELERAKPGTGLGLFIVRTLVERLGGTVRIRDRERGSGTTFEVQLPGTPIDLPAGEPSQDQRMETTPQELAAARE
jgi:two-component system, OmpR family, phosphate regulon sensor histidine kinase PhoR